MDAHLQGEAGERLERRAAAAAASLAARGRGEDGKATTATGWVESTRLDEMGGGSRIPDLEPGEKANSY